MGHGCEPRIFKTLGEVRYPASDSEMNNQSMEFSVRFTVKDVGYAQGGGRWWRLRIIRNGRYRAKYSFACSPLRLWIGRVHKSTIVIIFDPLQIAARFWRWRLSMMSLKCIKCKKNSALSCMVNFVRAGNLLNMHLRFSNIGTGLLSQITRTKSRTFTTSYFA